MSAWRRGQASIVVSTVIVAGALAGCLIDNDRDGIGITPVFPIHHDAPAWSVGNRIAFRDNGILCVTSNSSFDIDPARRGIWVLDFETRDLELLAVGGDLPAWSPTGDTLAFTAGGQIYTIPQTGGSPIPLTSRGASSPRTALSTWSLAILRMVVRWCSLRRASEVLGYRGWFSQTQMVRELVC